jgi:ferrochelatase
MEAAVYVGMRCWKPSIADAVAQILRDQITHLVLLPMFPQYSVTTTGSCLKYFGSLESRIGLSSKMKISAIESWFEEPLYVESMTELIMQALAAFATDHKESVILLYSAHSIPAGYVEKGDPFLKQTQESVALINSNLGNINEYRLAFQSKVGPVKWLGPSTNDVIADIGRQGKNRVLAIPISFVSDHIETLQEIDIQYKNLAERSGIVEFCRVASLNLYPKFINALAEMSIRKFVELQ